MYFFFLISVYVQFSSMFWGLSHFVQDECLLDPELYERAEKLFRGLLHYITDFLVWEENFELSAELQPWYGLHGPTQLHPDYKMLSLTLMMCFSIHTAQKTMHTTVYCTTMSTTCTTMSSTPCSALLTVMRQKHRRTQHLLTRRCCFNFRFYFKVLHCHVFIISLIVPCAYYVIIVTVAQGRRAVKRGTLRSCQQAAGLIRVNSSY